MSDFLLQMDDITASIWENLDGSPEEPYSLSAEKNLLASLLRNNLQFDVLKRFLKRSMFFDRCTRDIWTVFEGYLDGPHRIEFQGMEQGVHVKLIQHELTRELKWSERHEEMLESIAGTAIPSNVAKLYAMMLVELHQRRAALNRIRRAQDLLMRPHSGAIAKALEHVTSAAMVLAYDDNDEERASAKGVALKMERYWERLDSGEVEAFVPTGMSAFDAVTHGGLHLNQAYTIGGLTGHGKTTVALAAIDGWLGYNKDGRGSVVNFHTSEMTDLALAWRLMSTHYGTPERELRKRRPEGDGPEAKSVDLIRSHALKWLRSNKMSFYAQGTSIYVQDVINKARAKRAEHPDDRLLVVVDYLQYCRCEWLSRGEKTKHLEEAAEALNALAKDLEDTTIILLTQFNKDGSKEHPLPIPDPDRAKWASAIHDASPNFLIFHRPFKGSPDKDEVAFISLSKSRYGADDGHAEGWVFVNADMVKKKITWGSDGDVPPEFATGDFDDSWPSLDGRVEGLASAIGIKSTRVTKDSYQRMLEQHEASHG